MINRLTIFSKRCPDQAASFWLAAQAQAAIHLSRRFTLKHVAPSDKYHRDCYYSHSRHLSCCTLQETGMKVLVLTLHRHRHPPYQNIVGFSFPLTLFGRATVITVPHRAHWCTIVRAFSLACIAT
jgi:hypothetical protein